MPSPLGEFEQLVLLALVRLGDTAYGVTVADEITRRTGRQVSLGAVYKTLDRLESKALISSEMGEPTAARGGRRKRLFRLEPSGERALRAALAALDRMVSGLAWKWRAG